MNRKARILGFLILVIIYSCGNKDSGNDIEKAKVELSNVFYNSGNDSVRNKLFEIAYNNQNTSSPSYLVFIAKNLNTGEIKEICTEAPFLSGAMHNELGMGYDLNSSKFIDSLILGNSKRVFEFKEKEALENISFNEYPSKERIEEIAKKLDLEDFIKDFGSNENVKYMEFKEDEYFLQLSYSHILFNCGIITSRSSVGGNTIWFGYPSIRAPEIPDLD